MRFFDSQVHVSDLYRVIPFPEPGFDVDEPAQSTIRDYAKRKDRRLRWLFGGMAVFFALAIMVGFSHLIVGVVVCLIAFMLSFLLGSILLLSQPRRQTCGRCGQPLETVWTATPGGFSAEYRICRRCGLYRYMFRTSRR